MISWMQKHNKFLVWTIWIATIAFIGAGPAFNGFDMFGNKAKSVARVGDINIEQKELNLAYSNIYNKYNEALQGSLDEKKAKELGLVEQAFSQLKTQAQLLNFAKDLGIFVSDKEVANEIASFKVFQEKGVFSKDIYHNYLKNQRLKTVFFEERIRRELIIGKLLKLFPLKALPLEEKIIKTAMSVSDKIAYRVLTNKDVTVDMNSSKIKDYWETTKDNYQTLPKYDLSLVWIDTNDVNISFSEAKSYYEQNSFNYINSEGIQQSFEEVKDLVTQDLQIKKRKKDAQKAYIALKKERNITKEQKNLKFGDKLLPKKIWKEIKTKKVNDLIKPQVVDNRYITLKIEAITPARTKTFDEARMSAMFNYQHQAQKEALFNKSQELVKSFDKNSTNALISDFLSIQKPQLIPPFTPQEAQQLKQKLFTSSKEKGIIQLENKIVIYSILEQKEESFDKNETKMLKESLETIKKQVFETNLLNLLDKKYPTQMYMKGVSN